MELRGTRCLVRHWRARDAESLVRQANNINIASQLRDRFPHPYTAKDARGFLLHSMRKDTDATILAIDVGGLAVGAVGISRGTDVERYTAEIGYWLGEPYWGRGIVTEAVTLLTAHAFEQGNVLRLFALPFSSNARSARVLEKAGYEREGVLRASAVKYGQPRDQLLYARVNTRWKPPASPDADARAAG